MAKRKTSAPKIKKKKWFPIHAPAYFSNHHLGDTYVNEESEVMGKYLTANLSTIQKSFRKQSMNVHFRVVNVADGKAETEMIGYSLITSAVKRLVRRGRDKIADSFLAKTKDKQIVRLKPLVITMNKGTKSLQSAIRLEGRRVLREYAFTRTTQELFADIVEGKVQKMIKLSAAKLAPIKQADMRIAKLEENTKVIVTDKEVESEKVTIRRKDLGEKHLSEEELKALEEAKKAALAEDIAKGVASAPEEPSDDFDEDFGDDDFDEDDADEDSEEVELQDETPEELSDDEDSEDNSEEDESAEESDEKKTSEK